MDPTLRDVRTLSFSAAFLALDHVEDVPITPEEQCLHSLLLAAHLFICGALRQDHGWTRSLPWAMTQRLRESLGDEDSLMYSTIWTDHLPELVWVLFVGAVISEEHSKGNGIWFVSRLEVVRKLVGCDTRLKFERYLHSVVWDDIYGVDLLNYWWAGESSRR